MRETILALEAGAFDFIRKPSISNALDIEQVRSELMKQLNAAMQAKQRRALWEEEEQKRRSADITLPLSPKPSETTPKKKPQVKETRPAAKGTDQRGKPAEPLRMPVSRSAGEKAALPDVPELSGFKRKRVERKPEAESAPAVLPKNESRPPREANAQPSTDLKDLVAVGCSTGGPRALKAFLEQIPGDFHAPIVIVQHMPPNFTTACPAPEFIQSAGGHGSRTRHGIGAGQGIHWPGRQPHEGSSPGRRCIPNQDKPG